MSVLPKCCLRNIGQRGLVSVGGDHAGLVERTHCVVSLSAAVLVQGHEVDCPPWCVVLLGHTDHTVAPGSGGAAGNLLDDSDGLISVEPRLDLLMPVEGNGDGAVAGDGLHTLLEVDLDFGPVHGW